MLGPHSKVMGDFGFRLLARTLVLGHKNQNPQLLAIFPSVCSSSSLMKIAECRSLNFYTNAIIIVHLATVLDMKFQQILSFYYQDLPYHSYNRTLPDVLRLLSPIEVCCKLEMMRGPNPGETGSRWCVSCVCVLSWAYVGSSAPHGTYAR